MPAEPSFLTFLDAGATPWRRLPHFPIYDGNEQRAGDELVDAIDGLLAEVDPIHVDRTAALPDGLIDDLRAKGFLALRNDAEHGGLGASDYNAFRVVERASHRSVAIGQLLAVHNGIGVPALLPSLPPGPLRDVVARYVRAGAVSGCSDTEPSGQNNRWRDTIATSTEDGTAYLLDGDKRFASNSPIAGLFVVTAVVDGQLGLVFVDLASPGVTVSARHEFLGSRGLPNGSLHFDRVRVPAEQVIAGGGPAKAGQPPAVGRLLINAAPGLAIARECLRIGREFVAGRRMDGRPLGDHDQIQRYLGSTLAQTYALDSVIRWSLLGGGDRGFEQALAKNICTVGAWQIADRTLSVLGGAGFETAASKLRRGVAPMRVEQLLRDARGLRVAGNVDFMIDVQAGRAVLDARSGSCRDWNDPVRSANLSPANRDHLSVLVADLRRLAGTGADDQETLRLIGRISGVLLTMFAVLARVEQGGSDVEAELADVYCTSARHQLAGLWHEFSAPRRDFSPLSRADLI